MPRAYFIAQFDIHDPQTYAAYRAATPLPIEQYGGRFLARGGRLATFEGEPPLPRVVVIEFPSFEQAQAWYGSADYQKLIPIRLRAAVGKHSWSRGPTSRHLPPLPPKGGDRVRHGQARPGHPRRPAGVIPAGSL